MPEWVISVIISVVGVIVAGAMLVIRTREIKATVNADAQTKISTAFEAGEKERRELVAQLTDAKDKLIGSEKETGAITVQLVDALHQVQLQAEKQKTSERLIEGFERQIKTYDEVSATSRSQINALTALTSDLQDRLKTTGDELTAVKERAQRAEARAERAESELATERQRADDEEGKRKHLEVRVAELEAKAARVPELEEQVKRLQGTIDAMQLEKENAHVPSAVSDPIGIPAGVPADGAGAGSDAGNRDGQPPDGKRVGVAEPTAGG